MNVGRGGSVDSGFIKTSGMVLSIALKIGESQGGANQHRMRLRTNQQEDRESRV